jgi:predicted amidohydrolase
MKQIACLDQLTHWMDEISKTYVTDTLQYIVFNGLKKIGPASERYFNMNLVLDGTKTCFDSDRTYKKTYIPGREKQFIDSGIADTLVLETAWGKLGFLTCYDACFPHLSHQLAHIQGVDGIIVTAAWRKQGKREYKELNIIEDVYYQVQWNIMMQALACQNQVWVMAANAVGPHTEKGLDYCGSSGIWAPSGINMIKGSDTEEELLILHNIDMIQEIATEKKEFCFKDDVMENQIDPP